MTRFARELWKISRGGDGWTRFKMFDNSGACEVVDGTTGWTLEIRNQETETLLRITSLQHDEP